MSALPAIAIDPEFKALIPPLFVPRRDVWAEIYKVFAGATS